MEESDSRPLYILQCDLIAVLISLIEAMPAATAADCEALVRLVGLAVLAQALLSSCGPADCSADCSTLSHPHRVGQAEAAVDASDQVSQADVSAMAELRSVLAASANVSCATQTRGPPRGPPRGSPSCYPYHRGGRPSHTGRRRVGTRALGANIRT